MKIFFTLIIFLSSFCIRAQITFQKTYGGTMGDAGLGVLQTSDGGYITVGNTASFGPGNIYLIKTNVYGDTLWTKTIGGVNPEQGNSIAQTTDGGYIIGGTIQATSSNLFYLVKTNNIGDTLWTKSYISIVFQADGYSVRQTSDGGYIIAGVTNTLTNPVTNDVYLIKTDSSGNMLWRKTYGMPFNDWAFSVKQANDGGYVIAGYTCNSSAADNCDVYLIKTDGSGNLLWSKTFGGAGEDYGYSVQQTNDGGYIVSGQTNSFGTGDYDVYLIKTDGNGDTLWTKSYTGISATFDYSVIQTSDGGYIISGINFIKTDNSGNVIWTKTYGGTGGNGGKHACQTSDGGYILTGSIGYSPPNFSEVYLIKADALGNSGCNESIPSIFVSTPPTQVATPSTTVTSPPVISSFPAAISFGSGGIISTFCINFPTETEETILNEKSIFLSPNPAVDELSINGFSYSAKRMGEINIYNTLGEKVLSREIGDGETGVKFNIKNLAAGIYVVKVSGEKLHWVRKFVKE